MTIMKPINPPYIKICIILNIWFRGATLILILAVLGLVSPAPVSAQTVATTTTAEVLVTTATLPMDQQSTAVLAMAVEAEPADPEAALYTAKCAGCHTIGGGMLTGPDLLPSSQWPRADLEAAIQRMEKNVGPLAAQEIQDLADLLQSGGARERIAAEQQRVARALAAQMEPGSPSRGKALFLGRTRLANGGPPCMACHQVNGHGGSLGLDLSAVSSRMSGVALVSAIEGANFNVMRAAYANRPITKQEAMHLAAWLEGAPETAAAPAGITMKTPIMGSVAGILAAAFLGAMAAFYRRRASGVRARLVSEAATRG